MNIRIIAASLLLGAMAGPAAVVYADDAASTSSTGQFIDDSAITTKVKAAFVKDKEISVFDIAVKTDQGVVSLSGTVKTKQQADRVVALARRVQGVKEVQNNVTVQ